MSGRCFDSIQMIDALIGFDTVSSRSNLALIEFVEHYLAGHGIASRRTSDDSGGKANLFATIGPEIAGGVVLSGHSDVVPVEGQDWSSDPFTLARRDGRLYGRGTADMKSFIAVALALVPEMRAAGLERPIHLALSYDEELGCRGVPRLIAELGGLLPRPAIAIVGEPPSMRLVSGHKGGAGLRTTVTGKEAHSSQPHRAANAVMAAARLIGEIERMAAERRAAADPDSPFEPPYTTFNVGMIEGGTAPNIVPRSCAFQWEYRLLPGDDGDAIVERFDRFAEEQVLPELRRSAPEAAIVTEARPRVPPLAPEPDSPAEALVRALIGANRAHMVSFGTEAGLFQEAGLSTVVCGPGSIDQAHQPDEFIEIAQVEACEAMLRRLIAWAAGKPL
jgi:acetylornithine deacetylase